jgi:Phosphopantetheinyl transferase
MPSTIVTLLFCPISLLPEAPDLVLAEGILDTQELARLKRCRDSVAVKFLYTRWMVKTELGRRLGIAPRQVSLAYSDNGKPYCPDLPELHFSISHCNSALGVVFAPVNVGMDIEEINRRRTSLTPPWADPNAYFGEVTAAQVNAVIGDSEKARVFTLLWTLVESQVKYCDSSIMRVSKSLELELDRSQQPWKIDVAQAPKQIFQSFTAVLNGTSRDRVALTAEDPTVIAKGSATEIISITLPNTRATPFELKAYHWLSPGQVRPLVLEKLADSRE